MGKKKRRMCHLSPYYLLLLLCVHAACIMRDDKNAVCSVCVVRLGYVTIYMPHCTHNTETHTDGLENRDALVHPVGEGRRTAGSAALVAAVYT